MKNLKHIYGLVVMMFLFASNICTASVDPIPLDTDVSIEMSVDLSVPMVTVVSETVSNLDTQEDLSIADSYPCITADNHTRDIITVDAKSGTQFYKQDWTDTYDYQIEGIPIQYLTEHAQAQAVDDDDMVCYLLSLIGIDCKEIVEEEGEGF